MKHYKDLQNNLHALEDVTFEHLLPEGCVEITEQEVEEIVLSKVVPFTYQQKRAPKYPPIEDGLDALVKSGVDLGPAWKAYANECLAVKDSIPKE